MHKEISPEEKLLSIIRGKRNTQESGAPKPEIKDVKPLPGVPWKRIDDYISALLKNDFLKNSILDARALKVFNQYAIIIAALIAGYIILDAILVSPSRKAATLIAKVSVSKSPVVIPAEEVMPVETKGYSYYSNRISGRNIFGAGSSIQSESQTSDTGLSAESQGSDLGLVGIVPGDSPQAIIEDKKSQKTYYLTKGQSANGITVEDMDKDKVMLEYKGKKMTLFL